jgi:molybdopterin/thiamine biosynthesis adenylyltransferase
MTLEASRIEKIIEFAESKNFPDSTPYSSISVEHIKSLSKRYECSGREIEIEALKNEVIPERYARNFKTFTARDQIALLDASVTVVGLGGLGGAVVEILARIGIGSLNLIDGDSFEDSNLNRQFLCTADALSTAKAMAAAQRVNAINRSIDVTHHHLFMDEQNSARLLKNSDLAVDCLDNLKTRFIVENACKNHKIPMVSAAVAGTTGHLTTIFPEDRGLRLIYGEPDRAPLKGAETLLGTIPYAVTFMATLECAEVIKIIQKKGSLLRNKLLIADLNDTSIEVLQLI